MSPSASPLFKLEYRQPLVTNERSARIEIPNPCCGILEKPVASPKVDSSTSGKNRAA